MSLSWPTTITAKKKSSPKSESEEYNHRAVDGSFPSIFSVVKVIAQITILLLNKIMQRNLSVKIWKQ
jgi:hypothetical protein